MPIQHVSNQKIFQNYNQFVIQVLLMLKQLESTIGRTYQFISHSKIPSDNSLVHWENRMT